MIKQQSKAFMSYAHVDNRYGQLTEFRERLSNEVRVQTGEEFPIFQDRDDIILGQNWRQRIEEALVTEVVFLLPIITPSFFNSKPCREEFELFLEREKKARRNDLILPIYHVNCRLLEDESLRANDPLAEVLATRQWADWRGLRFEPFTSPQVGKALMQLAGQISLALERLSTPVKVLLQPPADILSKKPSPINVFMVYSHEDERLRGPMETHLKLLMRRGIIGTWHDRRITAGNELAGEIDSHLNSAQIILFLISVSFLTSDYCYGPEMARALERHEAREARVIPIILRACDWGGAPFAKLQALPKDARPITSWANRDSAFIDVSEGIEKIIAELARTRQAT